MYRNEGLRALLAAEAVAAGDWFTPRLYGEPHLTKPPGMGVLIALCGIGHVHPITARLPSILAGLTLIVLAGCAIRSRFGREAALVGMLLMPCSIFWLDRVPSAEIDLVQTAWVAGSLLALLHAIDGQRYRNLAWVAAMLCVAGGLFTKWTGPAFFYLTAVTWLAYRRQLVRLLDAAHLVGLAGVVVLFLLWAWHAHAAAGEEFFSTLEREAMMRLSPARHPRPYPWGELLTFPLAFVLGCLPAALLVPWVWRGSGLDDRQRALWSLALAWVAVNLAFWTIVPGHRPRHILPAQPAVALLAAIGWYVWRQRSAVVPYRFLGTIACLWLVVKAGFVLAMHQRPNIRPVAAELRAWVPREETLGLVQLKDENLLFAYGRPAVRGDQTYCLMPAAHPGEGEWLVTLRDSQGAPLKLLRREKESHQPLASAGLADDNK